VSEQFNDTGSKRHEIPACSIVTLTNGGISSARFSQPLVDAVKVAEVA